MKIKIGIVFLASALAVVSCSSSGVSSSNSGPDKQSLPTPADVSNTVASDSAMTNANAAGTARTQDSFYVEAAQGGLAEVELGKLASQKAQNAEVKSFAQMMVADHGKANAELQALTAKKQLMLPAVLSAEHQSAMSRLQGLSGAEFDKAYVDAMVAAHEKDVALFERQAASDADPDAKAFAAKTLPVLRKHLETIKGIQSKLK